MRVRPLHIALVSAFIASLAAPAFAQHGGDGVRLPAEVAPAESEPDFNIAYHPPDDPEIAAAIEQARGTLPYFWSVYEAKSGEESDFQLKVQFATPDGATELLWVSHISPKNDEISGAMANVPVVVDFDLGEAVTFGAGQVIDWGFVRDDLLVGHYTTRVLLSRMPPETAAPYLQMLGEAP